MPDLPSRTALDDAVKVVHDHADRIFLWNYDRSRGQLVTLYNKAMGSQWNSVTDLDWSTEVDPLELVDPATPLQQLARAAREVEGSPIASWGEDELHQLGLESFKAQLSQFMHGEQGAMMTAAKIVETVPWIDAKYYAATQTMDEARHTEVFAKYLHTKLGEAYPMSPFLDAQITALLEDGRWDIVYLGMQIVIESLALAAFGSMLRTIDEPLLRKLLRYVMSDEARHVAFGVLSLAEYYGGLSEAELKDRQEFLVENTLRNRTRSTTPEVWERMGVSAQAVYPALAEAAGKVKVHPFAGFQKAFFSKLVPNVDTVPELGGKLTQWHIHDNLCFSPGEAPKVRGLTGAGGGCPAGLVKADPVPMIHVWIVPHECGPFAALEGVGAGQIKEGQERLCDHAHGA